MYPLILSRTIYAGPCYYYRNFFSCFFSLKEGAFPLRRVLPYHFQMGRYSPAMPLAPAAHLYEFSCGVPLPLGWRSPPVDFIPAPNSVLLLAKIGRRLRLSTQVLPLFMSRLISPSSSCLLPISSVPSCSD